ncbi:exo-alpha-sialidase [Poriferisphaera sp. WC338]|uniref:exo-alpha-sialidase n=1 Tax=Poriferisphaera sp. WC338 TaxID=3425129 RepID=UPI003D814B10
MFAGINGSRIFMMCILLISLSYSPYLLANETSVMQRVVFKDGEAGYKTFRIPTIIQAKNGDLLAFAEGRVNSRSDTGDIDLVMKRSTDSGETWEKLTVVQNHGQNTAGNPVPILDRITGNIVLVYCTNNGQDSQHKIQHQTSEDTRRAWVTISQDHGVHWSTPIEITDMVKDPKWRWYATGPGGGIQLQHGKHKGRLIVASTFNSGIGSGKGGGVQLIYSDDGGKQWHKGGIARNMKSKKYLPSESQLLELENGQVYIISRNRAHDGTKQFYQAASYMTDGGMKFIHGFQETHLANPLVEGAIERFSSKSDGLINPLIIHTQPRHKSKRREFTIHVSEDETKTWSSEKLLYRGPCGYSDITPIKTDHGESSVGVLYEQGDKNYHERIVFAKVSASWAKSNVLLQIDASQYQLNKKIRNGATIRDQQGNGVDGTLVGNGIRIVNGDPRYHHVSKYAFHFDGKNDSIQIPDQKDHLLNFAATENFTLEFLFRTEGHHDGDSEGSGPLLAKDVRKYHPSYWVRVQNGRLRVFLEDGKHNTSIMTPNPVNDGEWHHAVIVRDKSIPQLRMYLDHKLVGVDTDDTDQPLANDFPIQIGTFNSAKPGKRRFAGDIQFIRVSSGALKPEQFIQPLNHKATATEEKAIAATIN